jgi:hypothetical protein
MNNRQFLQEVDILASLSREPNQTFSIRLKLRKQRRLVNKMIKQAAKAQAQIVYNQTCNLYQDIVKSNLE